ncbi:hypothetical protein BJ741DRAFT_580212 [Chytriomyces cf. hyalinus JEL632]|nr:hypothetical protein BJ741DRAFT_580212 [Chytriomyces cf. hyalinus JEL632]
MPLTQEQKSRVAHEVDNAGLVNQKSCLKRIDFLSRELQCDAVTMTNYIRNYRQQKGKSTAKPRTGPEELARDEPENSSGYNLFLHQLGKKLEDINKQRRREDSQAELVQMKDFQMVTSHSGDQVVSKWAALSQEERNEFEAAAKSASEEKSVLTSTEAILEMQRKSYLVMVAGIKNFVKNGGSHIGWHIKAAI